MDVKLIMFRRDDTRRVFPLAEGTTTIGRKDDCEIRIPLAAVSRHHAEIVVGEAGAVLRDLGAANGTFINNRRIQEEDIRAGDQIQVGPVVFTVQINDEPSLDEMIKIRTNVSASEAEQGRPPSVGTSKHVYVANDDVDPIAALEALASSADQTSIEHDDDFDDDETE